MTSDELRETDQLVTDILEGKRKVPSKVRDELMFTMVALLYRDFRLLSDKVTYIRERSIVIWIQDHPRLATIMTAGGLAFLAFWSTPEFRRPVLAAFGLPQELNP